MSGNYVKKIAIVGATGTVGRHIVAELLRKKQTIHQELQITAITRTDSTASIPGGVRAAPVDYGDHASLVAALAGHDVLVITLAVAAPGDTQEKLVTAAVEAGVEFILPNFWGVDTADEKLGSDILLGLKERSICQKIEDLGQKSAWIGMVTSFWYEMSLASPWAFGMDYPGRKWTFYDEGETKINVIVCGRAVANLLTLPLESATGPSLSGFKNRLVYTASFCLSQRDMFESVLRVTGAKPEDWEIRYETTTQRFADGQKQLAAGDRAGFGKLLYSRVFFQDGSGNYEEQHGLHNDILGLDKESLDEFTKIAIARVESGSTYP
ncbi:hypothetical protein E8E14_006988 [Neopestalotiopsis sp. 37M]|nr:hypothetical protein E8E14_006988 [Neopestalotiopsis sp. 37M]